MILGILDGIKDFFNNLVIGVKEGIYRLVIFLVRIPYDLAKAFFSIFQNLATFDLFDVDTYEKLARSMYIVVGVAALFVLAYHLITLIVDPDKNKGGSETYKLIKNFTISLILMVLCPTIFKYSGQIVKVIVDSNIIPSIVSGTNKKGGKTNMGEDTGAELAAVLFGNFFNPESEKTSDSEVKPTGSCSPLSESLEDAKAQQNLDAYYCYARNLAGDGSAIRFDGLMSLICGWFMAFTIFKMCYDMAVRLIKLLFYEMVSPICIMCRVVPGKESVFKNWSSAVFKTYIAGLIKIFLVSMVTTLVSIVNRRINEAILAGAFGSGITSMVSRGLLYVALLVFMKDGSKYIDELMGLGDTHVGLGDAFKSSGLGRAASTLGAAGLGYLGGKLANREERKNAAAEKKAAKDAWKKEKTANKAAGIKIKKKDSSAYNAFKEKRHAKNVAWWKSVGGGITSAAGAGVAGYKGGKDASFGDIWKNTKTGAAKGYETLDDVKDIAALGGGGLKGLIKGAVKTGADAAKGDLGLKPGERLKKKIAAAGGIENAAGAVNDNTKKTIMENNGKGKIKWTSDLKGDNGATVSRAMDFGLNGLLQVDSDGHIVMENGAPKTAPLNLTFGTDSTGKPIQMADSGNLTGDLDISGYSFSANGFNYNSTNIDTLTKALATAKAKGYKSSTMLKVNIDGKPRSIQVSAAEDILRATSVDFNSENLGAMQDALNEANRTGKSNSTFKVDGKSMTMSTNDLERMIGEFSKKYSERINTIAASDNVEAVISNLVQTGRKDEAKVLQDARVDISAFCSQIGGNDEVLRDVVLEAYKLSGKQGSDAEILAAMRNIKDGHINFLEGWGKNLKDAAHSYKNRMQIEMNREGIASGGGDK